MKILVLSGSLRKASFNTRLGKAIAKRAPEGVQIDVATCHGIPLYDGDVEEAEGVPQAVVALRDQIKSVDALILLTPEYNGGMPGVFKNTLDWLTRPGSEINATFKNLPTGLCGATPGGLGTTLAQSGSLVVLRQLKLRLFSGHLRVSGAADALDTNGAISDKLAGMLDSWLTEFVEFARKP